MTLTEITRRASDWLRGIGPMHDVVISSRIRLARNIAGMPFLSRCTVAQKKDITTRLKTESLAAALGPEMFFVDVSAAGDLDRHLLAERHLISRHHAEADYPRGLVLNATETIALMINEEDHLRTQVMRSGLQLNEAMEEINRIDDALEERIDFAFSRRYGYLTACPTNVGTGLRISVMLHLPALKLTGEIDRALRAARDMHLAVRGLYGEGSEASGDLFQVSNQVTLGRSEEQIIDEFLRTIVPQLLDFERKAREALQKTPIRLDDKIYRAIALLRSARRIGSEEAMYLLSLVRLGVLMERIRDVELKTIGELFLLVQPAHLQRITGRTMDGQQRSEARAEFLRTRLAGTSES